MYNKATKAKLLKVRIGTRLDVEKLESIIKEVSGMAREKAREGTIIELHRVDVKEDETAVFITGEEPEVDTLVKTLQVYSPTARPDVSEAEISDLYRLP